MAREYALLGNYDTSLVYYQGVIQQIQKHIQQLKDDAIMKQEWHQVRKNNILFGGMSKVKFSQMLMRRKLKNATFVLFFRYVSQLSKSMTKSKKSIKPLQISRRIQYTLGGLGVHMKRNQQGTQMCGHHPLQLRETTGICSTTVVM